MAQYIHRKAARGQKMVKIGSFPAQTKQHKGRIQRYGIEGIHGDAHGLPGLGDRGNNRYGGGETAHGIAESARLNAFTTCVNRLSPHQLILHAIPCVARLHTSTLPGSQTVTFRI